MKRNSIKRNWQATLLLILFNIILLSVTFGLTTWAFIYSIEHKPKLSFILNRNGKPADATAVIIFSTFLLTVLPLGLFGINAITKNIKCPNCKKKVNFTFNKTKTYNCEHCQATWKV